MIYLIFSILCSSLIFVIFKLFDRFGVQTFYAIIVNYITACSTGLLLYGSPMPYSELPAQSWFIGVLIMGVLFIVVFNLMAQTSQKIGVSVASVATKMALVFPVLFSVVYYKESLSVVAIIGILLALVAVYLTSIKEKGNTKITKNLLLLPLFVFIGSGCIDASIGYFQESHLLPEERSIFSSLVFGAAGFIGIVVILFKSGRTRLKFNLRNGIGGVILGIPNYFSIYFLFEALGSNVFSRAGVFTLNNVAIVLFSTLLGITLFKEKLSITNWAGVLLSAASIILIALF